MNQILAVGNDRNENEKNGLENIVILHNGKDVRELFKMVSNLT